MSRRRHPPALLAPLWSRRNIALLAAAVVVVAGGAVTAATWVSAAPGPVQLTAATTSADLAPVSSASDMRVVAEPWSDGASIEWTPVLGALGYDVFRVNGTPDEVKGTTTGWVRVNADPITDSSLRDAGLRAGQPVTFSVKPRYSTVVPSALRRPDPNLPMASTTPVEPLAAYRAGLTATCPSASAVPGTVVGTSAQLSSALSKAAPGGVVRLKDGVYTGTFRLSVQATGSKPFWLCGGPGAVLQTGNTGSGSALRIDSSSWVGLAGFSVRDSMQGVMVKSTSNLVVANLNISNIGYEALHVYAQSSDVVLRDNSITDTGVKDVAYGEGIYIGTSDRRWGEVTGGQPDATTRVAVVRNTIVNAGAEPIEAKMGTTNGVIQGNVIRGHQPASRAIGWILVTGNDWLIKKNQGEDAVTNGYVLMRQGTEYGHDNSVVTNTGAVNASGWGVLLQNPGSPPPAGSIVGCDNDLSGAAAGEITGSCQN
ncbi:Right handed beta helix region [Quadrisphaera granulorum]|uniref:Parallel beta helix pectate lyase-like protein n=1 Tax=Quadrisphaera granulorum TaxID=317664 RepID=A0A315ZTX7_9ACTN|nr:right-handed parallel beta-helix repeat-containing protein [Quadrisphaera granulorum]PWJ48633.1 parallel beta helix pectate lyase-like protein [Quadrisphaera granulorum]SZE98355.1 Right handed beta helix region [Quadrisphaera granulorum]